MVSGDLIRAQKGLTKEAQGQGVRVGDRSGVGERHQHGGEGSKGSDTHFEEERVKNKVRFGGRRVEEGRLEDERGFALRGAG